MAARHAAALLLCALLLATPARPVDALGISSLRASAASLGAKLARFKEKAMLAYEVERENFLGGLANWGVKSVIVPVDDDNFERVVSLGEVVRGGQG